MPAIVGGIWINQITSSGNAIFGDAPFIKPVSTNKNFNGSGGGNTGIFANTNNLWSSTNTVDPNVNEQNIIAPGPGLFSPLIPPPVPVPVPAPVPGRVPVGGAARVSSDSRAAVIRPASARRRRSRTAAKRRGSY